MSFKTRAIIFDRNVCEITNNTEKCPCNHERARSFIRRDCQVTKYTHRLEGVQVLSFFSLTTRRSVWCTRIGIFFFVTLCPWATPPEFFIFYRNIVVYDVYYSACTRIIRPSHIQTLYVVARCAQKRLPWRVVFPFGAVIS